MGLFDNLSKKMEENSKKRKQKKEEKHQEDVEYKQILNTFKSDHSEKFEGYYFDLKAKKILKPRNILNREYKVSKFEDIISYSINKKEHNDSKTQTKRKHSLARAVVGGALTIPLGGVGSIVGGLTGTKETTTISKDFIDHLGISINFKDGYSFEITFVETTTKTSDLIARSGIEETNKLIAILQAILKENKEKSSVHDVKKSLSSISNSLDEIKKLKELLDMNAITQEEFDAKKKELLDL